MAASGHLEWCQTIVGRLIRIQFSPGSFRRKFTALDLDLLMAIASRVRDKGTDEVAFTFEELKRLAGLQRNMTNDEFAKQIANVNRRLLALNFEFQNEEHDIIQFALFAGFVTSPTKRTLTVSVNSRFSFLLNDLTSQFTRFELAEFTALRSSYAKENRESQADFECRQCHRFGVRVHRPFRAVGNHAGLFWFSIYRFSVSNGAPPAVPA